ncbi:MAG TPA: lipopolysaccharide biosynthesis protein [Terriglobales bacterium]|nr:lipopolysaccharide biosynthesis protein [Terriglobales bacterium]
MLDARDVEEPKSDHPAAESISPAAESTRRMDRSLAHSLAWRAGADWFSQILSWSSFIIVVRLLTPADFGIVAMAMVLWAYLRYLGEFGIPQTIVTLRDLTEDELAQLNTVAILLGFGCFGLASLLAYPLAAFFKSPQLVWVVVVTCSGLVALGFRAVPEGLLSRDMRFRTLSLLDATTSIIAATATLVMVFLGLGYWSLVLGNLAGYAAQSVLTVAARPHRFAFPRLGSLRRPLLFGWRVLVSVVASSAYERLDNVTAGRVLGQAALGVYGMAWNLANVPMEKLTTLVTTTIPTYFAAVQNEPAALRRYLRTLTETLAIATFPATIGLALVARDLIPFALGPKWDGVVVPLQILSVYVTFRSVVALLGKLLTAVGNPRFVMWDDLAALIILPTGFYIGSHWGTRGIAWGWVVAYPLVVLPLYWKTFKTIEMPVGDYLRALRPALHGTVVMVLAVTSVKWTLVPEKPLLLRLVLEIVTGAAAYIATLLLLHRERMLTFLRTARNFRQARA